MRRRRPNLVDGEWRWSFARRQVIHDLFQPEQVYIDRWRFDTPIGSVFVHRIMLPDAGRDPHTHPFSWSWSLILKGGYTEHRGADGGDVRSYWPGRVNRFDIDTIHRIDHLRDGKPVWTLFAAGKPHGRGWGFVVDGEYQDHKEYLAEHAVTAN